jgi:hypothetical protein
MRRRRLKGRRFEVDEEANEFFLLVQIDEGGLGEV